MNVWHSAGPGPTWPAAEAGASTVLYDRSPFLFAKMAAIIDIDEEIEEDFWSLANEYVNNFIPRRPRVFRDRLNPLTELDEEDFRVRFRLTKSLFCDLLDRIEPELSHSTSKHGGLLPIYQLAVGLRFYASGSFLVSCC